MNNDEKRKMKLNMRLIYVIVLNHLLFLFLVISCSNNAPNAALIESRDKVAIANDTPNSITRAVAEEMLAYNYVDLMFNRDSTQLSKESKMIIQNMIDQARRNGKIEKALVFSWSDVEYPSIEVDNLTKDQTTLAAERNNNIEEYLGAIEGVAATTYNMAEHPSTLSTLLNTSDAKLKEFLLLAGISTSSKASVHGQKASHAIVLIVLSQ